MASYYDTIASTVPEERTYSYGFWGGLSLDECLRVHAENGNGQYLLKGKTFSMEVPLVDTLREVKIDPAKLKAAQLSGYIVDQMANSPTAIRSLLEAMSTLPNLTRFRVLVAWKPENLGELIRSLVRVAEKAEPKRIEVTKKYHPDLHEGNVLRLSGGALEFHILVKNDRQGDRQMYQTLFSPTLSDILQECAPGVERFGLCSCPLYRDTFQRVLGLPNLQHMELSPVRSGFVLASLAQVLGTTTLGKKRKRGQALGSLNRLKTVEIRCKPITRNKDGLILLLRALETNTTLEHISIETEMLQKKDTEEFCTSFLSLLRNNHTLDGLEVRFCGDFINDVSPFPLSLEKDLEDVLKDHNQTISRLDLGWKVPFWHCPEIIKWLLLNMYKLRPFVETNKKDYAKQQFLESVVEAKEGTFRKCVEKYAEEYRGCTQFFSRFEFATNDLVSSLFLVLQGNPMLVTFLEESFCP